MDLSGADALGRLAVAFSDGVIEGEEGAQPELLKLAEAAAKPVLKYVGAEGEWPDAYDAFLQKVCGEEA